MIETKYTEALEAAFERDDAGEMFSDDEVKIEATDRGAVHVVYTGGDDDYWAAFVQYCRSQFNSVVVEKTDLTTWELWFPRH